MQLTVPAYARSDDAGGGAFLALHAALQALGYPGTYGELLLLAGAAFTFVYDNAPVFEPLRDLSPVDGIRLATRAAGLNGRWLVDGDSRDTLRQLAASLAEGNSAVVSLYSVEEHHGYAVVVGCDAEAGQLTIQAGERAYTPNMTATAETFSLPDRWWGAVTGPQGWAACPAFLIDRSRPAGWSHEARLQRALARGIQLLHGGAVPYHDCDGSREFSAVPLDGRNALYGLPAYDLLAADVAGSEWLGGFDLIWRLDAQLTQLSHHRGHVASCLGGLPGVPAAGAALLCRIASEKAADLASRFWYRPTRAMPTAGEVLSAIAGCPAMLFSVSLSAEERSALEQQVPVVDTAWGPVAIVDEAARRRDALTIVQALRRADEQLAGQLQQMCETL